MHDQQESTTRREWLVRLGRQTILGVIGLFSLIFIVRRAKGECINTGLPCPACRLFEQCLLPQAEETRVAERKEKR